MSGLTIYKASAGSGKTFAITREYIHLLFRDTENYRRTLGVTFTNKATAEMKNRIVSELDKLARGEHSGYADGLMKEFNLPLPALKQRASVILSRILHDYSHFTILTIDSFFQRVLRAFAREAGFYQGFDIELDQDRILTAAVDQMIFDLDSNPVLKDWLVRFAEDRIVEGSNWNFNRDIEKIGNEVFKENFKELSDNLIEKLTDKEFLHNFGKKLDALKIGFEKEFRQKGIDAQAIIRQHGLIADDFKGKSRSICSFFEKHARFEKFDKYEIAVSVRNHYQDVEQWKGKDKTKNIAVESAYHAGLNRILGEIIGMYDSGFALYKSALEVQKYLYLLGVVADLLVHIREYTSGRNLFMISDTAQFLRKLIQASDAPFVYERTGIFIRHFMIDEFQDTSSLQWNNFKPLMVNSLAENNANWVVGDVKQSIYRWRNSDWTILSEKIFDDVYPHEIDVKTLDYNWRSSFNIVSFNNTFFRSAVDILLAETKASHEENPNVDASEFERLLTHAYSDFAQLVPESKDSGNGYVNIEFIPSGEDKDVKFEEVALAKLPGILEALQDNQYDLKDIAILVRTRNEGDMVSEYLLKFQKQLANSTYRYDILSNDSLLLKNSEVVKWLVSAITCITSPGDELNKAFLTYEYETYLAPALRSHKSGEPNAPGSNLHQLFSVQHGLSGIIGDFFSQQHLKQYPVYELCDKIIAHFELGTIKGELPFIQAFQDMLQEYSRKEPVDLNSFLRWWEENGDKRVINMPDDQDAVRLMTFHSAKGLEFKAVIMPFGDWPFMKSGWGGNVLWCHTAVEPFSELELLPVNLTKGLQNTIFSYDYFHEKALSYVDNLNLLYVAFTRAVDALYVIAPEPTKDAIDNNMGSLLAQSLRKQSFEPMQVQYPAICMSNYWKEEDHRFEFGALPLSEKKQSGGEGILLDDMGYTSQAVSDIVKQVIPARDYFSEEAGTPALRVNTGKIMHEVFQYIKTPADVDAALRTLVLEGKITGEDTRSLSVQIKKLLSNKQVSDWFSGDWEVRTEAGILLKDGSLPRPDRVLIKGEKAIVVDYKFGDSESTSYLWQVRNYMRYLRQMGYRSVDGYIWYVYLDKVQPVPLNPEQGKLF